MKLNPLKILILFIALCIIGISVPEYNGTFLHKTIIANVAIVMGLAGGLE